jgi:hypothetical protein
MRLRVAVVVAALLLVGLVPAQAGAAPRFAGAWKGTWKYVKAGGAQPQIGIGYTGKIDGDFLTVKGATIFDFPFGGGEIKLRRRSANLVGTWKKWRCKAQGGYIKNVVSVRATRSVKFQGVRYATAARGKLLGTDRHCDGEFRSKTYALKLTRPAPKVRAARFDWDGDWVCGSGYVVSFRAEDDDLPVDARQHDVAHSWGFGDGSTSGAASKKESVKHTYATPGSDQVTLTEALWDGSVARRTEQLDVPPPECG